VPLDISVANEKGCSGERSDAPARKIYCCVIIRSFDRKSFHTFSLPIHSYGVGGRAF
jgi:hypothetical protein